MAESVEGGVVVAGFPAVNRWGGVLLLVAACAVALYLLAQTARKWRASSSQNCLLGGAVRLAAARGLVGQLDALSTVPGFQARRRRRSRRSYRRRRRRLPSRLIMHATC